MPHPCAHRSTIKNDYASSSGRVDALARRQRGASSADAQQEKVSL